MELRSGLKALTLAAAAATAPFAVYALPSPGVYSFSGSCNDCPPYPGPATAQLNVPTNSPSDTLFTYQSSIFPSGLQSSWIEVANLGPINASGYADAWILFGTGNGGSYDFRSDTTGKWTLTYNDVSFDEGDTGIWAARPVPEPGTYGLMALGLLGLAVMRRRLQ
jgi:hypothetical protein